MQINGTLFYVSHTKHGMLMNGACGPQGMILPQLGWLFRLDSLEYYVIGVTMSFSGNTNTQVIEILVDDEPI